MQGSLPILKKYGINTSSETVDRLSEDIPLRFRKRSNIYFMTIKTIQKIMPRVILTLLFILIVFNPSVSQTAEKLVEICAAKLGDAQYLRDFQVELEAAEDGSEKPVAKYSLILSSNTQYRLMVCNAEDSDGSAIIELYDGRGFMGSNYSEKTGKKYPSFDVQIKRTDVYHIFISFKDGNPGRAVAILAFVKRL